MNPDQENVIDLHGMNTHEAVSELEDFLYESKTLKRDRVFVVTGKGINSEDGVAVVRDVVEAFLNQNGFSFKRGNMFTEGGEGVVEVFL